MKSPPPASSHSSPKTPQPGSAGPTQSSSNSPPRASHSVPARTRVSLPRLSHASSAYRCSSSQSRTERRANLKSFARRYKNSMRMCAGGGMMRVMRNCRSGRPRRFLWRCVRRGGRLGRDGEIDAPVGLRSRGEKEVLCKEFRRFATVLDMPLKMWPRGLEEFESYVGGQMRRLEENGVSKESRGMARVLLFGLGLPWYLAWVMPVVRLVVMANWLPKGLREAYGLLDPTTWAARVGYVVLVWLIWGEGRLII
ncbi:hypothetical protein B0H67DRAFT_157 [Lasiosphaeris hirsuta]|uniref:ER-bound oxygenase mpaB/mpaB'/Rubber oxygenase catalytic domain-containing protein n=1 Tax=Lasiosphaeris hirsuta TaxID=260670 RepID=A0AA40E5X6_9PEZI|nr:hypothetical protein B0H67DRAFT_157 [Lasiosphaeris hirsuta]